MFNDKIVDGVYVVEVCKVNHRPKRNNIGQYYVSIDYFYPFGRNKRIVRHGRLLFFKDKKSAQKVIVGYKMRV